MATGDHNLRAVVRAWLSCIEKSWEVKKKDFQDDADEAMAFYNGPYDFLYSGYGKALRGFVSDEELPQPTFRMTVNKVSEIVQLFGPALYSRNPVRKVNPRKPADLPQDTVEVLLGLSQNPMMQQGYMQLQMQQEHDRASDEVRAILLEHYLNYTPLALDLKTESRWAIDEALIKGMGTLWVELYTPPGGGINLVGNFYDSVDNLTIDPDAENIRDAKWIARRCVRPYWEVEQEYGLPQDSLKDRATLEGYNQQATVTAIQADYRRKQGMTNDLLVYWKIFSKMGLGGRLAGIKPDLRAPLEAYGQFCYLVVCEACPFPLNIPPPLDEIALVDPAAGTQATGLAPMGQDPVQQIMPRVQWPTPFWADDAWPFTPIYFHSVPKKVWPISHVKPGLGELKFLNWAFSFLAGKIRVASRDFIAIAKSAGEDLKEKIKHAGDYTIIEVEQIHESIDKVVKFLQHPGFNPEIYHVIEGVAQNFERRTGLSELLYGQSARQMRSAQEAQIKGDYASIRPDDMANKVEDAMSEAARKEALACRWHLQGQDVAPILGELGAWWWQQYLVPSDPTRIVHQLEYRIEAGSAKKPNKGLERENMQAAMQNLQPQLWEYATMTGNVTPFNALISAWANSVDLDASSFLLPAMPPPAPPAGPAPAGGPQQQQQPAQGGAA